MNVAFLTDENIDTIVGSYRINRFTYHQLLSILIEESRERLSSQISLYAADLNTKLFYSEKGLKDRKQKIKFKCMPYVPERKAEEGKTGGFFEGLDDYDRCLKIMKLHNTKVAKIISTHNQKHEDKQNGIIRIPSSVTPKVNKKKKGKKIKKSTQVDVVIKFKDENGKVEEMVFKNTDKKKKITKKKVKTEKENEDPSLLEEKKESTEEETSDNINEQSEESTSPHPEKSLQALRNS